MARAFFFERRDRTTGEQISFFDASDTEGNRGGIFLAEPTGLGIEYDKGDDAIPSNGFFLPPEAEQKKVLGEITFTAVIGTGGNPYRSYDSLLDYLTIRESTNNQILYLTYLYNRIRRRIGVRLVSLTKTEVKSHGCLIETLTLAVVDSAHEFETYELGEMGVDLAYANEISNQATFQFANLLALESDDTVPGAITYPDADNPDVRVVNTSQAYKTAGSGAAAPVTYEPNLLAYVMGSNPGRSYINTSTLIPDMPQDPAITGMITFRIGGPLAVAFDLGDSDIPIECFRVYINGEDRSDTCLRMISYPSTHSYQVAIEDPGIEYKLVEFYWSNALDNIYMHLLKNNLLQTYAPQLFSWVTLTGNTGSKMSTPRVFIYKYMPESAIYLTDTGVAFINNEWRPMFKVNESSLGVEVSLDKANKAFFDIEIHGPFAQPGVLIQYGEQSVSFDGALQSYEHIRISTIPGEERLEGFLNGVIKDISTSISTNNHLGIISDSDNVFTITPSVSKAIVKVKKYFYP